MKQIVPQRLHRCNSFVEQSFIDVIDERKIQIYLSTFNHAHFCKFLYDTNDLPTNLVHFNAKFSRLYSKPNSLIIYIKIIKILILVLQTFDYLP